MLPVEPYELDDEDDSEACSDCRNCCSTSATELVLDELSLLPVDEVDDEASVEELPPW